MILIKNIKEIYTMNESNFKIEEGYIIIKENIIQEIGETPVPKKEKMNNIHFDKIINGENTVALPGLINTHTHSAMTLLRGFADDLPLKNWLEEKIWPVEAKLSPEDIYWGSLLAIIEMIKSGTTTFADMYFKMDQIGQAVKKSRIRAVLSQGLIEANDGKEGLKNAVTFCKKWNNKANKRITTMLAPHAPYTCSPEYLEDIYEISRNLDLPINIHIAETKNEIKTIQNKYNLRPLELLEKVKLLERPIIGAHCVHLNENDIELLKNNKVGVAYNPNSNMKLGSGIAPVNLMLKKGIKVGIGTDGTASNNNLDLIEEAKIGSYLQKANNLDPTLLDVKTMSKMLTINGARILHLENLGKLQPGFLADLILIDIKKDSVFYPHHNNLSNILYAANGNSVKTVLINGNVVMENKKITTINEQKVYREVERIGNNLT
ncbi:MAG: amidohydrolase [bacterium]